MKISGKNFINGTWTKGSPGTLDMINPSYDGKVGEIALWRYEEERVWT